jgi:hypothetical protein
MEFKSWEEDGVRSVGEGTVKDKHIMNGFV